ncbi:hypothetical protein E0H61_15155 [Rhizobium leguminosarum bv. viciae]|nr:hypothetical protein E0H61_15155 [Rhizobium leguminosarum bv. viciae]
MEKSIRGKGVFDLHETPQMDQSRPMVLRTEICLLASKFPGAMGRKYSVGSPVAAIYVFFWHSLSDNSYFNNRETSSHATEPTCRAVS